MTLLTWYGGDRLVYLLIFIVFPLFRSYHHGSFRLLELLPVSRRPSYHHLAMLNGARTTAHIFPIVGLISLAQEMHPFRLSL